MAGRNTVLTTATSSPPVIIRCCCSIAKATAWRQLRPGNVHDAEGWEELLLPEIERQQRLGKEVVFRADAAFAKPSCTRPWKNRT
jgi:hypothetical protein